MYDYYIWIKENKNKKSKSKNRFYSFFGDSSTNAQKKLSIF